jgi:hypothetical protein
MNEESNPENNDIALIGIAVLFAMATCLLVAALVIVTLLMTRPGSRDEVDTGDPVVEPNLAEETLSRLSSVEIPSADLPTIAERLLGLREVPAVVDDEPIDLDVGTRDTFWVTDVGTSETNLVEAELVYVTEHVYFWIGVNVPYELEDVRRVVENFERSTYPTVRTLIGHEWSPGVDSDQHLYMLYVREIGSSVAGLFFAKDEYSSLAQEFSNEHEMFYLNADTMSLGDGFADNLLAHEFQHMVHWNLDRNEDTWLTEGFSELTEHLLGFEVSGFDYLYAQDTDIPLLHWPSQPGSAGKHYGQSFLFMTYMYDRFGAEAIHTIAQNPENGLRSIEEMLIQIEAEDPLTGRSLTIDDLFMDWGISLVLQDPDLSEGQYGLRSYRGAPQAQFSEMYHQCPLQKQSHQVSQYGFDFILIECQDEFDLLFTGEPYSRITTSDPHSGNFAYWSNKGDSSDTMLTRSFDFRDADGPIQIDYWTWYHIEDDYDYLYFEVSTNDGETWQILPTQSGTSDDPSGNSYGWAYNGLSGNQDTPIWIKESVDLSAYAGQEVLLRFEYITDTAVNTEGFLLDDVSIDAVGYEEDFEQGSGGWTPDGFVRIHNLIPQNFQLAIIERGSDISIKKVEVDSTGRVRIPLSFEGEVEDVILVVAGTTRYSWVPATYRIEIVH